MNLRIFLFAIVIFSFSNLTSQELTLEHINGPEGGGLAAMIHNDNYAFYSGYHFLYRTADGENWEKLPEGNFFPLVTGGDLIVGSKQNSNILNLSRDNGETWEEITKPVTGRIADLAVCQHGIYTNNSDEFTIFRSKDEGQSWEQIPIPIQHGHQLFMFDERLYVGNYTEIWRTDTNGENWEKVSPSFSQFDLVEDVFAVDERIYIDLYQKFVVSNDGGKTWRTQSGSRPNLILIDSVLYSTGGSTALSRSYDFGETWEDLTTNTVYDGESIFYTSTINSKILGATNIRGVVTFDDSTHKLKEANTGLTSASISDLKLGDGRLWAATGTGVFYYDLNDKTWTKTSLPSPSSYINIATGEDGLVIANSVNSSFLNISTDNGLNWQFIDLPGSIASSIQRIKIVGNSIFLSERLGVSIYSNDLGQTWIHSQYFTSYIVEFGGQHLMLGLVDQIYASTDNGLNWNPITNSPIYSASLHKVEDRLFIVSLDFSVNGNFYRISTSTDGINWQDASAGAPRPSDPGGFLRDKEFFFYKKDSVFYMGLDNDGLFASTNNVQSWFPVTSVNYQNLVQVGDEFYTAGFSGGAFKTDLHSNLQGDIISGTTYLDKNNNTTFDQDENELPKIPVAISQSRSALPYYSTLSDDLGYYLLGVNLGFQDTIRPIVHSEYLLGINPPYYLTSNTGTNHDFGIYLESDIVDLCAFGNHIGRPRPGFDFSIQLTYNNAGTVNQGGKMILELDEKIDYQNASPEPDVIDGKMITWNVSDLSVFDRERIRVDVNIDRDVPLGEVVKNTFKIETNDLDFKLENNEYMMCDTVVGSYDPNNKLVEPADGLTVEEVNEGKKVFYTVNFQNTGTFYAEKVRIADQLDPQLDWPSLELIAASHEITSFKLNKGGLLEVEFDKIFLIDSTSNEPESHGFVTFAIQRKKGFNPAHRVNNHAAIYFDFNDPIYTNNVYFTVPDDGVSSINEINDSKLLDQTLLIYPNPTGEGFTISTKGKLTGAADLNIYSISGKSVYFERLNSLNQPVYVPSGILPSGKYFVHISGEDGTMVGKIYVQK